MAEISALAVKTDSPMQLQIYADSLQFSLQSLQQKAFFEISKSEPVAHDRAVKDSKVAPFRLYDLRHTWATRAVEAGIDLVTLAAMLGHSKINMVLRYAHPTQEHQTKAMEKMEQFVAQKLIEAAEAAARQQGMPEMAIQ